MAPRVIVVGGGLSGLSAAHTIYLAGGNVVVLDKQGFFGGNSTKATSGINGALTRTQVDTGIPDSVKQFYDDTLKSARDKARPDLIKVLTYKSAAAVEWLQDEFNLDLTLVSRLGGHSQPRTHRGHDAKFPGMAITYALMQRLEELAESEPGRVEIVKKARVTELNKEGNKVTGVKYEHNGEIVSVDGPVVLATGGYAADFSDSSLLKKHRPDTYGLATTNGTHATGDGQKMVMAIGGNGIDMDKVQVHPTGLVDPKDPGSKWKFLAAEALRGEGGLLLNADGDRFCDELGHRDYVSGMMWDEKKKDKFPIRLILNSKASKVLDFHTRHYSGRGLMKKMTGKELAKEIGCTPSTSRRPSLPTTILPTASRRTPGARSSSTTCLSTLTMTSTLPSWSPFSTSPWVVLRSTTRLKSSTRRSSPLRVFTPVVSWPVVSTVLTVLVALLFSAVLSTVVLLVTLPATTSSRTLSRVVLAAPLSVLVKSLCTSTLQSPTR
ncbi:hypothetical protein NXS19_013948 [Fusarium pseudograminearum]|nr:hypothetical protein NXS19_013948 [Fusarium pseudograminearum]